MNSQNNKPDNDQNSFNALLACLLTIIAGTSPVWAGQSFTGKIVIDGQIYGENNDNLVKGNGVMGMDKRSVSDFHVIKVSGGINVNYHRANTVKVEISGDQNILPIIKTEVHDGILTIDSTKSYETKMPLTIELGTPNLSEVVLDGAGNLNLIGLDDKSLSLNISGSGSATVAGIVKQLLVRISGSGDVNAKNLTSSQADVSITGSGDIKVNAKDSLKASIMGSGDIIYFGNPKKVEPQILGSGEIEASN